MFRSSDLVRSMTVTQGMNDFQERFEYDESGNCIYKGQAARGKDLAENVWTVSKFTYDEDGNCVLKQTAFCAWSYRALESTIYS
jgi:hypothetical protein